VPSKPATVGVEVASRPVADAGRSQSVASSAAVTLDGSQSKDRRGTGLAYSWAGGATMAATLQYGSGLASSIVPPSTGRTPRTQVDLRATTGDRLFRGRGGIGLDIDNLFDTRSVINYQSAFSGTRFQTGRRLLLSANLKL
ncbi:MAG: hypothetical protein HY248_03440, partial [Fimbriimonas ginsengisoli]|nr:hypothetical protein [Fimbriimonas ginsengisoli]